MNQAEKFIRDVLSGKEVVNEYIRLAVNRHIKDCSTGHKRGLYFDKKAGEAAIYRSGLFRYTKDRWAGKPFVLIPSQAFMVYMIFGWKRKISGEYYRRFRKSYYSVGRKNAKTETTAMIANQMWWFDQVYGSEAYIAATKKDQAKITFNRAKTMMRFMRQDSPMVHDQVAILTANMSIQERESKFEPLGSDHDTMDGLMPYIVIIDEYHAHKTSGVLEVMETGMVSNLDSILFITTTAGFNLISPCYELEQVNIDILREKKQDDGVFAMIHTLDDPETEWMDEKMWIKSNPGLGTIIPWDSLRSQFLKARNEGGSKEVNFKTKNLNVWTQSSATWISYEVIKENYQKISEKELKGLEKRLCYGGLDLGKSRDLCSFVKIFLPESQNDRFVVIVDNWLPISTATEMHNRGIPYLTWSKQGWITLTKGETTDYDFIEAKIRADCQKYKIQLINYDRFNSTQLINKLKREGIKMEGFAQTTVAFNGPIDELERLFFSRRINHLNNPLLIWQMGNVELYRDSSGNNKISKQNSIREKKVDSVVALAMAIAAGMDHRPSAYATKPIRKTG